MYSETTNLCLWFALTLACVIFAVAVTTVRTILKSVKSRRARIIGVVSVSSIGVLGIALVYDGYQMVLHDLEHVRSQLDALERDAQDGQSKAPPERR